MQDHEIAKLVNRLTRIAYTVPTAQVRQHISSELVPLLKNELTHDDWYAKCNEVEALTRRVETVERQNALQKLHDENVRLGLYLGWHPIKTAPKDGTEILVCKATDSEGNPMGKSLGLFTHRVAWWEGESAWMVYNSLVCENPCFFEPTHWMPVPTFDFVSPPDSMADIDTLEQENRMLRARNERLTATMESIKRLVEANV